nr:hypothetical protein CFP56_45575 [Quercus suber]
MRGILAGVEHNCIIYERNSGRCCRDIYVFWKIRIWISESAERGSSSLQLQVGSVIVRGSGSEMKMLSLTLMKMIQMYALDEKMWKNLADRHSI